MFDKSEQSNLDPARFRPADSFISGLYWSPYKKCRSINRAQSDESNQVFYKCDFLGTGQVCNKQSEHS
jgi:hypothetical protein